MASDVTIIGAGLSGLCCAFHLARRGLSVEVLEARPRVGGRVVTVRDWAGDLVAEGGAEFIDTNHRHVVRYVKALGLKLRTQDLWSRLPEDPPGVEKFWRSLREMSTLLPSGRKVWPLPSSLEAMDRVSVAEWCDRLELEPVARKAMAIWCWGVEVAEPEKVSVLSLIVEERLRPSSAVQAGMTLEGGMDQLPLGLAAACRAQGVDIRLEALVNRVDQSKHGVEVHSNLGIHHAGRLVITLPATVLRELPIHPELSKSKREALKRSTYGDQVKTLLEFRKRFWAGEQEGPFVRLFGDELNSVWECTDHPDRAILVAWVAGPHARRLSRLDEAGRVQWALEALEKKLPGSRDAFERGRSFDWSGDPFSRGVYSHFQKGFLTLHAQEVSHPEGRIHFAGEHTSPFCGYMEGALESGVRAALEIIKTRGR